MSYRPMGGHGDDQPGMETQADAAASGDWVGRLLTLLDRVDL